MEIDLGGGQSGVKVKVLFVDALNWSVSYDMRVKRIEVSTFKF